MKFTTTIHLSGKNNTGIIVAPETVAALGSSRKPAVTVTIRGYSYPSTVATMGGVFMVPVSAEIRARTGVKAGDEVEVELVIDDKPRELAVPDDLGAAIRNDTPAEVFWATLSYSNRRRLVMQVDAAKAAETRARRIATIVARLHDGKA